MSINDPQWGNSHRPEQKDPDQVPDATGTGSTQPDAAEKSDVAPQQGGQGGSPRQSPPPPEGPPDLEVLWQQLVYGVRSRVARLLGRDLPPPPVITAPARVPLSPAPVAGVPESGPQAVNPWQSLSLKSWLIGVSLIVGAWLVSGFYLVDTQQRGVLSRFGQMIAVEEPGWHWRWPYPFETVRLVNVSADRTIEVGLSEQKGRRQSVGLMTTADGNLVNVAYAIVYQVSDPLAYLSRAEVPTDLLVLMAEDQLRGVIARQALSDVLGAGKRQPTPMLKPALDGLRQQLQLTVSGLALGVEIKGVEVREVRLPAPVLSATREAERESQTALRALRERQGAATEASIKAYTLAGQLDEQSAGYASGLQTLVKSLSNNGGLADASAVAGQFVETVGALRQQYPLLFASLADLQQRVTPAAGSSGRQATTKGEGNQSTDAPPAASAPAGWRDRELMRTRDRVDRPGSGS